MRKAQAKMLGKHGADTRGGGICYRAYLSGGFFGKVHTAVCRRAADRAGDIFIEGVIGL